MADENYLGGGLDIEGWSYHKHEVAQKVQGKKSTYCSETTYLIC